MADKYIKQVGGALSETEGQVTSAGAGDAGKIPALDAGGKLDSTLMPSGTGLDTITVTVEDAAGLAAGDLVNIFDNTGPKVRRADASNGRTAHGYVITAYADAASAVVYKEGTDNQLTGMTPGATQFLSGVTPGARTETAPSTTGHIVQKVGVAYSATDMDWEPAEPITLA
jgi:hypothetical protein